MEDGPMAELSPFIKGSSIDRSLSGSRHSFWHKHGWTDIKEFAQFARQGCTDLPFT